MSNQRTDIIASIGGLRSPPSTDPNTAHTRIRTRSAIFVSDFIRSEHAKKKMGGSNECTIVSGFAEDHSILRFAEYGVVFAGGFAKSIEAPNQDDYTQIENLRSSLRVPVAPKSIAECMKRWLDFPRRQKTR